MSDQDSQQHTDAAAFGEGFGLGDDTDSTTVIDKPEPKAGDDATPQPKADEVDYKALYESQKAEREAAENRYASLQGKYNAEVPRLTIRVKELEARPVAPQPSAKTGDDTAEGDDELPAEAQELLRDMPTVSKAVDALVRHRTKSIVREAVAPFEARIQPVEARSVEDARAAHFAAIGRAHGDWQTVVSGDAMKGWVDKLPSYRRGSVQQVLAEGDAQSVIEVLSDFKKESGYKPPAQGGGDDDDVAVVSRRSGGPKPGAQVGGDANDFNAGFNMD